MEKPIIIKPSKVRKLLDGEKTQDRRLVRIQPNHIGNGMYSVTGKLGSFMFKGKPDSKYWHLLEKPFDKGDLLWVRENFQIMEDGSIIYEADYLSLSDEEVKEMTNTKRSWNASIHMKYEQSRLRLLVTDIKIQRLEEITEEEARMEGFESLADLIKEWKEHGENPWLWALNIKIKENGNRENNT
ncbi:MAG: hypothetical protein ACOC4Y_01445 [bacterium]